jgi:hypothetical protein
MTGPGKRERYLYGDCAKLAQAVSSLTGWLIAVVVAGDPEFPEVRHAGVVMPDGRFLDIDGPNDDYEYETEFNPAEWLWPEAEWRTPEVLGDAEELIRSVTEVCRGPEIS